MTAVPDTAVRAGKDGRTPARTALVATLNPYPLTIDFPGRAEIVGGTVARKGWIDSEKARGLLHKGDKLLLYDLKMGEVGSVTLTDEGKLESKNPDFADPHGYCQSFGYRVDVPQTLDAAYNKALALRKESWEQLDLVAVWSPAGANRPHWITGELIAMGPPQEGLRKEQYAGPYRQIAAEWLRAHGFIKRQIESMIVEQVVRADVNSDKRSEVFLSFGSPSFGYNQTKKRSQQQYFSYLLMRVVDSRSGRVTTTVLDTRDFGRTIVAGFCDIDGDGHADIITQHYGIDDIGADLWRWADGKLMRVGEGWWFGA
jgi:hypothetical protein